MKLERRGATRYNFGAIAEVIDTDQSHELVSLTRNLSLSGCFVKTTTLFQGDTSASADYAFWRRLHRVRECDR